MKDYANVIAALILSAAILGAAWLHAQTGRYVPADRIIEPTFDTWTGEICLGDDPDDVQCANGRTGEMPN